MIRVKCFFALNLMKTSLIMFLLCQFLCHVLKALIFIEIDLKLSYVSTQVTKFLIARSFAPRPPKQSSPLQVSASRLVVLYGGSKSNHTAIVMYILQL